MLSPLPRHSGWATFAHSTQPYQPSPKGLSGRPAHRPFRGLLSVHSRYGLHTRAVTVFRDTLTEGFSHFVTSIAAPVASGWSVCRVGFAPTGERRLGTAHTQSGRTGSAVSSSYRSSPPSPLPRVPNSPAGSCGEMARSPPNTSALAGYGNAPLSQRLAPARPPHPGAAGHRLESRDAGRRHPSPIPSHSSTAPEGNRSPLTRVPLQQPRSRETISRRLSPSSYRAPKSVRESTPPAAPTRCVSTLRDHCLPPPAGESRTHPTGPRPRKEALARCRTAQAPHKLWSCRQPVLKPLRPLPIDDRPQSIRSWTQ